GPVAFEDPIARADLVGVIHRVGPARAAGFLHTQPQAEALASPLDLVADAPGGTLGQLDGCFAHLPTCLPTLRTTFSPITATWARSSGISSAPRMSAAVISAHWATPRPWACSASHSPTAIVVGQPSAWQRASTTVPESSRRRPSSMRLFDAGVPARAEISGEPFAAIGPACDGSRNRRQTGAG